MNIDSQDLFKAVNQEWGLNKYGNRDLSIEDLKLAINDLENIRTGIVKSNNFLNKIDEDWDVYKVEDYYKESKWYYWHRKRKKAEERLKQSYSLFNSWMWHIEKRGVGMFCYGICFIDERLDTYKNTLKIKEQKQPYQ